MGDEPNALSSIVISGICTTIQYIDKPLSEAEWSTASHVDAVSSI